jgi:hypothetical protein
MISYSDCSAADFNIDKGPLVAGKIVSFQDRTPGASEWRWTFGDESEAATDKEALHVYKHPGEYWVTLQVNGGCTVRKKITVRKNNPVVNSSRYPSFRLPSTARVGEKIEFVNDTEGANSWKWSFGETMRVDATSQNPTYTYQSSGTKTVTLIVNGMDRYATKKRITVFAKPVKKPTFNLKPRRKVEIKRAEPVDTVSVSKIPVPAPLRAPAKDKEAPELSRIQLEDYLLQVAEEKRAPESLKPFTCDGYKSRVRANGKEQTLQYLLQNFKGEEITIENLEVIKNKESRCIDYIKIDYKKKKVFGIF